MAVTRRFFLSLATLPVLIGKVGFADYSINRRQNMKFTLPGLPYEKNALEPFISAKTLDYHHGKHHTTYINNLNKLIENSKFNDMPLEKIITSTNNNEEKLAIFNNAAQVWNHTFYWESMKRNGGGEPQGKLRQKINEDFGSLINFVAEFKNAGISQFGSGWAWLILDKNKLKVVKTPNAMCPITDNKTPLLTMDVWEHAYYLDFQNRRPDYIAMFLEKLINWDFAENNFVNATK